MSYQPTKWVPTEEELVSLGFEKRHNEDYGFFYIRIIIELLRNVQFHPIHKEFIIKETSGRWTHVYPKSLEELRLLISMMNP